MLAELSKSFLESLTRLVPQCAGDNTGQNLRGRYLAGRKPPVHIFKTLYRRNSKTDGS